jgi:putative ABC transport system permease protein
MSLPARRSSTAHSPGARLYRALFRLWMPRAFRDQVGPPALETFVDLWQDATARGRGAALRLLARELLSLVRTGWRERFGPSGLYAADIEGPTGGAPAAMRGPGRLGRLVADLFADLRLGIRALGKRPGFTVVALLAIALGIGLNTAIFSLADRVFLRPLAYPSSERLALLSSERILDSSGFSLSFLELRDIAERNRVFEELAFFLDWRSVNLSGGDRPERTAINFVSGNYFALLGFQPHLGRLLGVAADPHAGDDQGEPEVVLAYELWQRSFGGDPDVLGRSVVLDDVPFVVVGVLSPSVGDLGQRFGQRPDAYLALSWTDVLLGSGSRDFRGARSFTGLARWRPGLDAGAVRADLDRISADLAREYPDTNEGWRVAMRPVPELLFERARESTVVLLGGAGLVLLLVCANLASLLLIQGTERAGELATRRALGAGRERVVRQLVTESLLLGALGGGLGTLVAFAGVRLLAGAEALALPTFVALELDERALAAALALSLLTGVAVGIMPALRAGRVDALASLRGARRLGGGGSARSAMLAAQVALAVMLIAGAVLLVESFRRLQATDLGFDAERLIVARLDLQGERYQEPAARRAFADALLARVRALPGVDDALLWGPSRLGGGNWVRFVTPEHRYDQIDERIEASRHSVLPGALPSLGIPLLRGRDIAVADGPDAPPVVLVSEALAQALWPHREAVGQRLETAQGGERLTFEVIGVTGNAKHRSRVDDFLRADLDLYFAYHQEPERHLSVLLRYPDRGKDRAEERAAVERLAPALRGAVAEIDPDLPIYQLGTLREQLEQEEARTRLSATLVSSYALLAMALAALGIYGSFALVVRQRAREIGLRLALGATLRDVFGQVLSQGLRVVALGAVLGVAGAFAVARLLAGTLYGAATLDLARLLVVIAGLGLTALLGVLLPARQVSRIEPTLALREE